MLPFISSLLATVPRYHICHLLISPYTMSVGRRYGMQSLPPLGTPMSKETQRRFVWTERFGLPFAVCLMESILATAPLAFFVVLGLLRVPLLGPAMRNPSIPLALAETGLITLGILMVAFSFYALAVVVERWHVGVHGW